MRFITAAQTDTGFRKGANQDSVLVKHALYDGSEILMAIVCDGMGGLAKGELASATVVRAFTDWFDNSLEAELEDVDMEVIADKWVLLLRKLNVKIAKYGNRGGKNLGTTFTGMLFIKDKYLIVHVGDSRVYRLDSKFSQLTSDQTFVAREVSRGTMTIEQAKTDKRRSQLLQCIGASDDIEPEIITGKSTPGAYIICSDGFRHEISNDEMYEVLSPDRLTSVDVMRHNVEYLIELVKFRGEGDNISAIVIKAEQ